VLARLRRARRLAPTLREAHARSEEGRLAEAAQLYEAALRLDPRHARAHYNLGLVRLRSGRIDAAVGYFAAAIEEQPDFAEAHNAAGIALRMLGRHEEAIAHYQKALAVKPDYAEAENNLGTALRTLERWEEAAAHYRKALALKPDYFDAESNLGAVSRARGHYEDAAAHYRKALALRPDSAVAHGNLGAVLQLIGRHEEALAAFDKALELQPDLAEAHLGRGATLKTLGRIGDGQRAVETAVELAPRRAEFYLSLAQSKRFADGDPHLVALEALARDIDRLDAEQQIHLHFALGQIYADLGQHERSFGHLVAGNASKRRSIAYDEAAALAEIEQTRAMFGAELIRRGAGLGDPSPAPVFIVGMPRSGTTLVEQILASHPLVHGGGERRDFETAVAGFSPGDTGAEGLRRVAARYLERALALAPAAARITDKMPGNFRHAGPIHLALPNARIIHVARDPLDTCFSCFATLFGGHLPYVYELGELGRYYHAYASLMAHWREVLPAGVMLEVRYEALVADFEPQARRIVAHCGLDWDDACLEFHKTQRPVWTASTVQVRRPLYRTSIGRAEPYRKMLGPLIEALGPEKTE
jgi:tetratricopeptide (TPR) repeat protein